MNRPLTDSEGFLCQLSDWNEQVAAQLAAEAGIDLGPAHWEILWAVRDYYAEYQLSPAMRPLTRYLKQSLGADKASSIYLLKLFPGSPAKLVSRLAGLPKPDNCL